MSECRGICTYETDKAANKLDEVGGDGVLARIEMKRTVRQNQEITCERGQRSRLWWV